MISRSHSDSFLFSFPVEAEEEEEKEEEEEDEGGWSPLAVNTSFRRRLSTKGSTAWFLKPLVSTSSWNRSGDMKERGETLSTTSAFSSCVLSAAGGDFTMFSALAGVCANMTGELGGGWRGEDRL